MNIVLPCNILLIWLESNQGAEDITDEFDGLDTEVFHDKVKQEDGHQFHL